MRSAVLNLHRGSYIQIRVRSSDGSSGSSTGASSYTQNFGYNGDGSGGRYGNVKCTSANNAPCAAPAFNPQTNRITSIGNQTPTYDNAGEMTSDGTGVGTTQYTWDAKGRVATVTPWGGTPTTYVYDAEGNRVEDTTPNRLFWYGASGNLLETTDAGTTNHDYVYFAGRRIARPAGRRPVSPRGERPSGAADHPQRRSGRRRLGRQPPCGAQAVRASGSKTWRARLSPQPQPAEPPDANAASSQTPYSAAMPLAMSEKVAVPLSAATTR